MQDRKAYILGLLILATAGMGAYAWHQDASIRESQSVLTQQTRFSLPGDSMTQYRRRLALIEERLVALQAAKRHYRGGEATPVAAPAADTAADAAEQKKMMQEALNRELRTCSATYYSGLCTSLNLNATQDERLRQILDQRRGSLQEVAAGGYDEARVAGMLQQIRDNTAREVTEMLGPDRYQQFCRQEVEKPYRNLVLQLQNQLCLGSTPLTLAQADQVVALLRVEASVEGADRGDLNAALSDALGVTRGKVSPEGLRRLEGVLKPEQLKAFAQLQDYNDAIEQMRKLDSTLK